MATITHCEHGAVYKYRHTHTHAYTMLAVAVSINTGNACPPHRQSNKNHMKRIDKSKDTIVDINRRSL